MPLIFNFKNNMRTVALKKLLGNLRLTNNKYNVTNRLGYDSDFNEVDFNKICQLIETKTVDPNTKNKNSDTILDIIASFGNHARLKKLLSITKFTPERLGLALIYASKYNNYHCVQELLEHGADVNWSFASYDAVQTAAKFGATDSLNILLEHGANVNSTNKYDGSTALMIAIDNKNIGCIKLLLKNEADTYQEDKYGNTAAKRINTILSQRTQDQFANGLNALHKLYNKNAIERLPSIKDFLDKNKDIAIIKALNSFYSSANTDINVNDGTITCLITCEDLKKDDLVEISLIKVNNNDKQTTSSEPVNHYMIQVCFPGTIAWTHAHSVDPRVIPGAAIPGSETVAFQTGRLGDLITECALLCGIDNIKPIMPEQHAHNSKRLASF